MYKRFKDNHLFKLLVILSVFVLTGCGVADVLLAQNTDISSDTISPLATDGIPATRGTENSPIIINESEAQGEFMAPMTQRDTLAALQEALSSIYDDVSPSIVSVQVRRRTTQGQLTPFGDSPGQNGVGSGFIWDDTGHIVTNNHVVEGASEIQVRFYDGFVASAEIVGTDSDSDLAIIKVESEPDRLAPVSIVDSDSLQVGDLAVALGSPFGLENTMTVGFISAVGRSLPAGASRYTIPRIIQTDAAINPGNSGGALVNSKGEVIGVNTAIISPNEASAGIGFAIPSSLVMQIVPILIENGSYTHAWLGISGTTLTNDLADELGLENNQQGVLIQQIVPDGPAGRAGLRGAQPQADNTDEALIPREGDVIVSIEGQTLQDFEDLVSGLVGYTAGETIDLGVIRGGERIRVSVILGERPAEPSISERAESAPQAQEPASAWIGIAGRNVTEEIADRMALDQDQRGLLVEVVAPDSPAEEAGFQGGTDRAMLDGSIVMLGGDIIIGWNETPIDNFSDLEQALESSDPGDLVEISVLRDGEVETLEITLGES